jgi:hypothetical protein
MKKILAVIPMAAICLAFAGQLSAQNPHWLGNDPTVSVQGNSLLIEGRATGLGNTVGSADFELNGTVDLDSRCYNRGGNKPQADNKQETVAVSATESFPVKNGRTNVSFQITPLSTLTCPGNQVVVVESLTWDLWLTSTTFPELDAHLVGSQ